MTNAESCVLVDRKPHSGFGGHRQHKQQSAKHKPNPPRGRNCTLLKKKCGRTLHACMPLPGCGRMQRPQRGHDWWPCPLFKRVALSTLPVRFFGIVGSFALSPIFLHCHMTAFTNLHGSICFCVRKKGRRTLECQQASNEQADELGRKQKDERKKKKKRAQKKGRRKKTNPLHNLQDWTFHCRQSLLRKSLCVIVLSRSR